MTVLTSDISWAIGLEATEGHKWHANNEVR
jgi:hypothetical protein